MEERNNIYSIKLSEISERLDPLYYGSDLSKYLGGKYGSDKLKNVVTLIKSGVGAGKDEQTNDEDGIIQIRPTNIDAQGFLKFERNVRLPKTLVGKVDMLVKGDVLFNNTNSQDLVGKTAILEQDMQLFYSNHITRIVVNKDKILNKYLWIILNVYQQSKIFYSICTNWNNQSGVGIDLLKSLFIPLPDINIQNEIVVIYDNAVQRKQQKEAEAQALLDSIDGYLLKELGITLPEQDNSLEKRIFRVGYGVLTGDRFDPNHNSHFNLRFNDSIKQYPKLGQYIKLRTGDPFPSSEFGKGKIPLIRIRDIKRNELVVSRDAMLDEAFYKNKNSIPNNDELLIGMDGDEFRCVRYRIEEHGKILINQRVAIISCIADKIHPEYLEYLMNSSIVILQFNRRKTIAGVVGHISGTDIKNLFMPMPSIEKQKEIATHIQSIRNKAKQLQEEAKAILENAKQEVEKMILGE